MKEIDFIKKYVGTPSVILDVGCYDCQDSFLLKQEWPDCRVVALEASPRVFGEIAADRLDVVEAYNWAVGASDDWRCFYAIDDKYRPGQSGMSGSLLVPTGKLLKDSPNLMPAGTFSVECRRIDSICKQLGVASVDYMRVDVQGAESLVLAGLGDVRPRLLRLEENECGEAGHYALAGSLVDMRNTLNSLGYKRVWGDGYNAHYVHSETNLPVN